MSSKFLSPKSSEPPALVAAPDSHQVECIVCADILDNDTHLHTVSVCGHPETICSMCFFRIRSLQHNFSCPTCKRQLDHVICVPDNIVKYDDFNIWGENIDGYQYDEPSKMFFPSEYFQRNIAKLRLYQCRLCNQSRRDFKQLKGHYFGEHQRHLCQLCHDHKQIFPAELVCYDQATYERHIRHGDGDGSVGHPNCEFCRTRFYDSHALFIHLSREHYTCHICEQLGQKFKYFHSYQHLEGHFRKDHIICEDPACIERRFVVFANEFDFAAHTRQYHPHLATGRGVQIRFNYKAGHSGGNSSTTAATSTLKSDEQQSTSDNPEYVSRNARFEGGLGGRAQNGEWQVEIQAMSRDPRDPNRHIGSTAISSTAITPQEEFPSLLASMGGSTFGHQKWSQPRSDGINPTQKRVNDFPSLPSTSSGKNLSFNKNSLVKSSIPASRINGGVSSSTGIGKKPVAAVAVGRVTGKAQKTVTEDDSAADYSTGNYSYDYDLSAAIAASLSDVSVSRHISSAPRAPSVSQSSPSVPQTVEEDFPALGCSADSSDKRESTTSTKEEPKRKINAPKPKLSNDLMDVMKMIGADPNKKKKKVGSGLTVVKTLKPKAPETDSDGTVAASINLVPPARNAAPAPPRPPSNPSIGNGPSWGKAYGGFGGGVGESSASNSGFPSLR